MKKIDPSRLRVAGLACGLLLGGAAVADDGAASAESAAASTSAYRLNPGFHRGLDGDAGDGFAAVATPGLGVSPLRLSIGSGRGLLPSGHELVLSSTLAQSHLPGDYYARADIGATLAGRDAPRATYRYTFLESPSWAWRIGLTTAMTDPQPALRAAGGLSRLGAMPLMHLSSSGRLGDSWQLNVDADGMRTSHGRALDVDLRLDYGLGNNLYVFGGYRLIEAGGDAEDAYGNAPANSANFGIRYRF